MAILGHEHINKLLKPFYKLRQSKIALNQTLTLKLGVTLVLTVTQVYVFVNLRRVTSAATFSEVFVDILVRFRFLSSAFLPSCVPASVDSGSESVVDN